MGQISTKQIVNANVYMDGNSYLGKTEEIKMPEVVTSMTEHKALGLWGKLELPSGLDKMESTQKWNSLYPEVLLRAANPFATVQLQCRSSMETYTGAGRIEQVPVVTYITGTFKKFPTGNFKQHDNVEAETTMSVIYLRQVVDGRDIIEVDVLANIFKVDGVDLLEEYKANIGG